MTTERRRKHRIHSKERQARIRARKGGGHVVEPGSRLRSLMMDLYAKCPDGMQVDHVIPLAKGGDHAPWNVQYLTPEDNVAKGDS